MKYFVSYAMAGVPKGPVAIDGNLSLEEALSLAGALIAEGSQDVFIGDGNDNQIGGEELAACCRGEKKLTPANFVHDRFLQFSARPSRFSHCL